MGFQMPGMAPPLVNQPPQIFGAYGPDGLPTLSHFNPDLAAHMFPDSSMLLDDSNEAKKRRIARVRLLLQPPSGSSGGSGTPWLTLQRITSGL